MEKSGNISVLYAEDDVTSAKHFMNDINQGRKTEKLKTIRFEHVTTVRAIDTIGILNGKYNLILLDGDLEDNNSGAVIKFLLNEKCTTPIVSVSANNDHHRAYGIPHLY